MTTPRTCLLPLLLLALAAPAAAQAKNLLFYGNSYSARNGGVGDLVRFLALEGGHAAPTVVERFTGGSDLQFHETDAGEVQAITTSLPAGQQWDVVVLQGQSLEATDALGDPAQFRSSAVGIVDNVRAHSPNAGAVLYQTWARAQSHFLYPGTFATPVVMHDQLRDNYRAAALDIELAHGAGTADVAAVGDGVALLEFADVYYEADLYHPAPAVTLLAGMCLFTSIYGQRVCELSPDFQGASPLVSRMASLGLGAADWAALAGLADRCADAATRPFPGSGDHLRLTTGVLPGAVDSCGGHPITTGDFLYFGVSSKNGVYAGVPAWIVVGLHLTGLPPGPSPLYPELHVDPGSLLILVDHPGLNPTASVLFPLPFTFPGISVLVQGIAWAGSNEASNPYFTTTDGHVFDFW